MISSINQSQPQFKAKFKPIDSSILINEALRSKNRREACIELTAMIMYLKNQAEKRASLVYKSGTPYKYNVMMDGKLVSKSNEKFTDAIRDFVNKKLGKSKLEVDETLSVKECLSTIHNLSLFA